MAKKKTIKKKLVDIGELRGRIESEVPKYTDGVVPNVTSFVQRSIIEKIENLKEEHNATKGKV